MTETSDHFNKKYYLSPNLELIVLRVLRARMAFFGLPERDLRHSLEDPLEDVAVYTWGEDGYDGLGDALQEARDDFNDETFGSVGPVGRLP